MVKIFNKILLLSRVRSVQNIPSPYCKQVFLVHNSKARAVLSKSAMVAPCQKLVTVVPATTEVAMLVWHHGHFGRPRTDIVEITFQNARMSSEYCQICDPFREVEEVSGQSILTQTWGNKSWLLKGSFWSFITQLKPNKLKKKGKWSGLGHKPEVNPCPKLKG